MTSHLRNRKSQFSPNFKIQKLQQELKEKEEIIQKLAESNQNLKFISEEILNSYSWKLIALLRKLIPINTYVVLKHKIKAQKPLEIGKQVLRHKTKTNFNPFRAQLKSSTNFKKELTVVAIPCVLSEKDRIISNFKVWNEQFKPISTLSKNFVGPTLAIIMNANKDTNFELDIKLAFENFPYLRKCFKDLSFYYCNLKGSDDTYVADCSDYSIYPNGTKAGPNNQFFLSMGILNKYGGYSFFMESDCYPIKSNWLGELQSIVRNSEKFWIKGSMYRGQSDMDERIKTHINGNAIYASGSYEFQQFLKYEIYPFMMSKIANDAPWLAYDCAIDYYFYEAISYRDQHKWQVMQKTKHLIQYTDYIQNINGVEDMKNGLKFDASNKNTYIIHGPKD